MYLETPVRGLETLPSSVRLPERLILDKTFGPGPLRLYCYLLLMADDKREATLSQKVMAYDLNVTKKTVMLNLKVLSNRGLIQVLSDGTQKGHYNKYVITGDLQ